MTQAQILAAIAAALQQQDSNGEYSNVTLVMQALILKSLPNLSQDQITNLCTILNINPNSNVVSS